MAFDHGPLSSGIAWESSSSRLINCEAARGFAEKSDDEVREAVQSRKQ
jgi:hypothetical protein